MTITIDINAIMAYTDAIVTALLPVVYMIAGIAMGFVIVGKIVSTLRSF